MEKLVKDLRDIQPRMRKNEVWRNVDFTALLTDELSLSQGERQTAEYRCNIPNLEADRLVVENGYCHEALRVDPQGVTCGSLREVCGKRAEFVRQYFGKCCPKENPYLQLNSDHYTDGVFIYVPDGVQVEQPIQLQSVINAGHGLFLQVRNLVVVGKGSHVRLIHCDDSYDNAPAFANNVTEVYVGADSYVEHYKMQNLNNQTGLLNHTYATLQQGATLRSVVVTLNGGHIRNHTEIRMMGEHCEVQAHGLFLNDQEQQVDNYIFVDHACPNCHSRELFKGILDDSARGTFNGHVLVRDGAVKTEAYQSNNNILLTDKAVINTKPFLEIYNDDVKCSHGAVLHPFARSERAHCPNTAALRFLRRGVAADSLRTPARQPGGHGEETPARRVDPLLGLRPALRLALQRPGSQLLYRPLQTITAPCDTSFYSSPHYCWQCRRR